MQRPSRLSYSCRLSLCRGSDLWKLNMMGEKFGRLYRKSESPNKNMTSDFPPEVAKYPKSSPKPPNTPKMGISNFGSVRANCLAPLATQLVYIFISVYQPSVIGLQRQSQFRVSCMTVKASHKIT